MAPHRLNSYLIISLAIITTLSITACSTKKMTKQEEYKKKQEDLAKKRKEDQEKKQKDWKKKQEDYAKKKKDERERQKELAAQAVYSWKGYEDEREKLVSALVNAEEDDARSRERDTPKPVRLSKKTAAIQPVQNVSYNAGENSSSDSGGCMSSFWGGVDTVNEVMPYVQQGVDLAQQYDQLQRSRRASYSSSSSSSSSSKSSSEKSQSSSGSSEEKNKSQGEKPCCNVYFKLSSDCAAAYGDMKHKYNKYNNYKCSKSERDAWVRKIGSCEESERLKQESADADRFFERLKWDRINHHRSCDICQHSKGCIFDRTCDNK